MAASYVRLDKMGVKIIVKKLELKEIVKTKF